MTNEFTRAPHMHGASDGLYVNAALLIDFDNVTMGIRSNLGHELRKLLDSDIIRGKVAVQRAYADWRRYPQYIVPLSEASIDLIFAPAYGSSRKNATDIRLAIDALELVFTRPEIGTYILLSGDSDFSSLVLKLKEYGKYVIGVGLQESSSDILVQNCDEYYGYNTLSGLTAASDMPREQLDPWELATRAVERMVERKDVMRSDRLKQVMLELDPSFDEKAAGFSKFNRFLAEAAHRGIVLLRRAPNGQYEVGPGKTKAAVGEGADYATPSAPKREADATRASPGGRKRGGDRKRAGDRKGAGAGESAAPGGPVGIDALRAAYDALLDAVRTLAKGSDGSVRDSEVKRQLLARDASFDEAALGFRKFSRFLQQARDEGIIDLEQRDDGNYYLRSVDGPGTHGPAAEPSPPPKKTEREAAGRGRGRRGRRGRPKERPEESDRPGPSVEDEAAVVKAAPTESPDVVPAETAEPQPGTPAEAEPAAPTRGRGLGRFRRGSRGRTPGAGADPGPSPAIGPVDDGAESGESEPAPEPAIEEPAAEPSTGARGLGRFRTGSRGRAGSGVLGGRLGEDEAANGTSATAEGGDGAEVGSAAAADIIGHMVRSYSGVGRRTAERLVQEFGESVFRVIDEDPERVKALLPKRQAQAVLDARQAERSQ